MKSSIPKTQAALPQMPLTIEGASVLHQMFKVRWPEWKRLEAVQRNSILREAAAALATMEAATGRQSALYSLLGHKGDLLFVHFRHSFAELSALETELFQLKLFDYLEQTTSYVSVVELGLYESTVKTYESLIERGIAPGSEEWAAAVDEVLGRQREAMRSRLYPEIPANKYACFYPMDRKRGENINWYTLPLEERQRQMHEHGLIGRRYAGIVKQIISGSIGLDDWEWGVDLFADDPVIFKKLIYEMRFDEVSAVYAAFGSFYVGVRLLAAELEKALE
ncbi:MAG TPA: hydrogen peroxide-dependent heme synthase [Terriglobales bacterium]|nr:hydrogen peroxide-dependent heme synthase [Terriglobales bacterium]